MAELSTTNENASSCCASEAHATCCKPSAKADCCGHDANCGCDAGVIRLSYAPQASVLTGGELLLSGGLRQRQKSD